MAIETFHTAAGETLTVDLGEHNEPRTRSCEHARREAWDEAFDRCPDCGGFVVTRE